MGAKGDGIEILKRTLRGYADHVNFVDALHYSMEQLADELDRYAQADESHE